MNSPSQVDGDYKYGRFDASALHIAHALKQTELQKAYNKRREKPIDYYLVSVQTFSSFTSYEHQFECIKKNIWTISGFLLDIVNKYVFHSAHLENIHCYKTHTHTIA